MSRYRTSAQNRATVAGWVALFVAIVAALAAIWGDDTGWSTAQQWAATAGVFALLAVILGLAGGN